MNARIPIGRRPRQRRWEGTGACQICDESIPTKPIPSNYKTVSKPVPTFAAAIAIKDGMLQKGACNI
ncbi:hypothetical protein [Bradyrhizobium sp. JYMT SZCCT0428]|uniref:hypothetical protein n=1 Tax=Bradyrhizobium sp. JYMT SZCCT0428 TaxID=2807673 RepID=UPI001BA5CA72|nr:hypothetical protein [Bradyrhizobium sp. JYMT SZCCT0428]MBR1151816.1 hypothetical protein [Bradyrhizobium sp. JYMT SZCCT0428]